MDFTILRVSIQLLMMLLIIHMLIGLKIRWRGFFLLLLVGIIIVFPLHRLMGAWSSFLVIFAQSLYLFFYTRQLLKSIITPFIMNVILIASFHLVVMLTDVRVIQPNEWDLMLYLTYFLTLLLSLLLSFGLRKLFVERQGFSISKRLLPFLLGLLLVTVVLFNFLIQFIQEQGIAVRDRPLILLIFPAYVVLLIGMFLGMLHISKKAITTEKEKEKYNQLQFYLNELEEEYKGIRKFRHDYMNILLTMKSYVEEKDAQKLYVYLEKEIFPTSEKMLQDNHQLALLGNLKVMEAKGLVSHKVIQAQNMGIEIMIEIPQVIETLNMGILDCCRMLGILLDNAIEESQKCETPWIKLAFLTMEDKQMILIENSIVGELPGVSEMFRNGFSTKTGKNRGQGLAIVREIILKSEAADLETVVSEESFTQKITLGS